MEWFSTKRNTTTATVMTIHKKLIDCTSWSTPFVCNYLIFLQLFHSSSFFFRPLSLSFSFFFLRSSTMHDFMLVKYTLTRLFSTKPWVCWTLLKMRLAIFTLKRQSTFGLYAQDCDFNNKWLWIFGCNTWYKKQQQHGVTSKKVCIYYVLV